ncbi:hypothetical protein GCM10022409_06680 [Hymenobacter glaciei]|uniref:Uncharacterized protein n=1 Tax=Hymenobacter glaciei TaxID=877209 RepID=A0ABP7TF01_9BACT
MLDAQPDPATLFDQRAAALLGLLGAETIYFAHFEAQGTVRFLGTGRSICSVLTSWTKPRRS